MNVNNYAIKGIFEKNDKLSVFLNDAFVVKLWALSMKNTCE